MSLVSFLQPLHTATKRDYLFRVRDHDKAQLAEVACQYGYDYWDGERKYGYGGYHYDGRWKPMAEAIAAHYDLRPGQSVADIGCGKGFLLYELSQVVPSLKLWGIDISSYAIEHAKPEIKPYLSVRWADCLPFDSRSIDLVLSINVLHNLPLHDCYRAIQEIVRVGRKHAYIVVDSYRTEREKANLLAWQLTLRALHTPAEWEWLFGKAWYQGDWEYVFYE